MLGQVKQQVANQAAGRRTSSGVQRVHQMMDASTASQGREVTN